MNREIKFRAWDSKSQRMYYQGEPDLEDIQSFFHHYNDDDELMQFTGLYDKNGKEIFTSDIVKWGMHKGSEEIWHRYAVVEMNPDIQFRILLYVDSKTGNKKITDNHVFRYGKFAYEETDKYLEIIGSIYENINLIK